MLRLTRLTLLVLTWRLALDDMAHRLTDRTKRDERGLSQSTETALLVAGAVLVATIIFVAVRALIQTKMNVATDGAAAIGGS